MSKNVQHMGTANAASIDIDAGELYNPKNVGSNVLVGSVKVTLTANYARTIPFGFPTAPQWTGNPIGKAGSDYPQTLLSGATLVLHAAEAAALINAGAATFVANV